MDKTQMIGNPDIWAQAGGLTGLVIFALFFSLGLFLWSLSRIYDMHRTDLHNILEMHQKEREEWSRIQDTRQKETNVAINAMTNVISEMNARSQRYTNGHQNGM
jgi:hypothetical protein